MKTYNYFERNRIKSQCNEEVQEYIEVLENIVEKAITFWANDYTNDQQKKKKLDDDLYDALGQVEFMDDEEE